MIVLGLTGSIGMGKTTAANLLRQMRIPVHCADEEVRRLYHEPVVIDVLKATFPEAYNKRKKSINKEKLLHFLGTDHERWDALEDVLHPFVRAAQNRFLRLHQKNGAPVVALDIPLLFETGAEQRVDHTICASAPAFIQRQRVLSRPGMTEEDFVFRLSRQVPDAEKRARSDFVIQTGAGIARTRQDLLRVLHTLRNREHA